jgi:hypothetical protein
MSPHVVESRKVLRESCLGWGSLLDEIRLNLAHAGRIEQIETALATLGKRLVVGLREAA